MAVGRVPSVSATADGRIATAAAAAACELQKATARVDEREGPPGSNRWLQDRPVVPIMAGPAGADSLRSSSKKKR